MGLLDHLWDDTVAGPAPDTGLGKLRKNAIFGFRSNSSKECEQVMDNRRSSFGEEAAEDAVRVSRSIMIVKPQQGSQKDSPPASPAGSTPPSSPFGGGGREAFRFRRRSAAFAYEKGHVGGGHGSPPPAYDV